jgi:hypothetical protein
MPGPFDTSILFLMPRTIGIRLNCAAHAGRGDRARPLKARRSASQGALAGTRTRNPLIPLERQTNRVSTPANLRDGSLQLVSNHFWRHGIFNQLPQEIILSLVPAGARLVVLQASHQGAIRLILAELSRLAPSPWRCTSFAAEAYSQIFNKFAPASSTTGRCTVRNHDFVSDGFLALIAACLVTLCSGLLVIAFNLSASSVFGLFQ